MSVLSANFLKLAGRFSLHCSYLLRRSHIKHVKENQPYLMGGLQLIGEEPFVFGFAVCFCT